MPFSSLRKQKKTAALLQGLPGESQNVVRHITARHNVEIQVTYDGLAFGIYHRNPRALLFFTIEFSQPHGGILKDTQINFSFDCHPTKEMCHNDPRKGCQNSNKRDRGVVDVSIPSTICGEKVGRAITRHFEYELAPNFEVASFGTISLGHIKEQKGYTQDLERYWDFTSRVVPPARYKGFSQRTDVIYEWKHNKNDIELFPKRINVAVIVNSGQADILPLTLSIDGSLGAAFTYFAKLKYHEVSIAIERDVRNPDALIQQFKTFASQSDTMVRLVTFEVECPGTSEDDVTVKIIGEGDALGCWEPGKASALTKIRDGHNMAIWKIEKLLHMWQDFQYKFIIESDGGRKVVWEAGENRTYSIKEVDTKPKQRQPIWEGNE